MGKTPPPDDAATEQPYDPRTLYEQLKANKDAKQEALEQKHKLSNQFRGIDDGESHFLTQVEQDRRKQELDKAQKERQEVERFRKLAEERAKKPAVVPAVAPLAGKVGVGKDGKDDKGEPSVPKPKPKPGKRKRDTLGLGIVRKKPATEPAKDNPSTVQPLTKSISSSPALATTSPSPSKPTETSRPSSTLNEPQPAPNP